MKTIGYLIAGCMLLTGCTERFAVNPSVTDDVSWTPNMTVTGNGYHRVGMLLDEVPSDQIIRNLSALTIEVRKSGESQYSVIDSLYILRFVLPGYTTSPVLEEETDYLVRFSAEYKNGTVKKGNSVAFHSPVVHGQVLKQIDHPQPFPSLSSGIPTDFAFWQGNIFTLFHKTLVRIDTATGNWTVLTSNIIDEEHDYLQMTFVQDTLVVVSHRIADYEPMTISWINAQTLALIRTSSIYPGEKPFVLDLTNDGSNLMMLVQHSNSNAARFLVADIQTGEILNEFLPPVTTHNIAVSYGNLWIANTYSYDNRIRRVDPSDFSILEDHQNPAFLIYELAWDGEHFWVFDYEQQTYSKLLLEGL